MIHRINLRERIVIALAVSCCLCSSPSSYAETVRVQATLIKNATVRKAPASDSKSLGRLPRGTVLDIVGEPNGWYFPIEVELYDDEIVRGWVLSSSLDRSSLEKIKATRIEKQKKSEKEKEISESKIIVPADEGALLRRLPAFQYGLSLGGNFSMTAAELEDFHGMGFSGDVFVGFYVHPTIPIRIELGYMKMGGESSENRSIRVGFLDMGALFVYVPSYFEIFLGMRYRHGISLENTALNTGIDRAGDLSSFFGMGGLGYRIPVSDIVSLGLRFDYSVAFMRFPASMQLFTLQLFLQFQG